jgi:hypothetical protein
MSADDARAARVTPVCVAARQQLRAQQQRQTAWCSAISHAFFDKRRPNDAVITTILERVHTLRACCTRPIQLSELPCSITEPWCVGLGVQSLLHHVVTHLSVKMSARTMRTAQHSSTQSWCHPLQAYQGKYRSIYRQIRLPLLRVSGGYTQIFQPDSATTTTKNKDTHTGRPDRRR